MSVTIKLHVHIVMLLCSIMIVRGNVRSLCLTRRCSAAAVKGGDRSLRAARSCRC